MGEVGQYYAKILVKSTYFLVSIQDAISISLFAHISYNVVDLYRKFKKCNIKIY